MNNKAPDIGSRIASALLDQVLGLLLRAVIWIVFIISVGQSGPFGSPVNPFSLFTDYTFALVFIGFSTLYYLKDIFSGRSIGKRILGLQIVNNKSNLPASPVRTVLRNFGFLLWIVEVVMILASPSKRLGDLIAGTKVVSTIRPQKIKFPFYQYLCALLLSVAVSAIMYAPFYGAGSLTNTEPETAEEFNETVVKEKQEVTEDLAAFFEKKYETEFESVVLSAQQKPGASTTMITGSFILKKDLFESGEVNTLKERIRDDLHEKMRGKSFDADITIVYTEGDEPKITHLTESLNE
ncbi:MAG: RDD family protein [Bacteroidia bacterium]|nr:RDD family protein [Bacteroidia bacterium]